MIWVFSPLTSPDQHQQVEQLQEFQQTLYWKQEVEERENVKHYNKDINFEENFYIVFWTRFVLTFYLSGKNFIVTDWICSADEVYFISIPYFTLILIVFEHLS